jgi:lipoate synthase
MKTFKISYEVKRPGGGWARTVSMVRADTENHALAVFGALMMAFSEESDEVLYVMNGVRQISLIKETASELEILLQSPTTEIDNLISQLCQ